MLFEGAATFSPALLVLFAALALDVLVGEPPNALHPVVWIGQLIGASVRAVKIERPLGQLICGGLIALLIPCLVAACSWLVLSSLARAPWLQFALAALLLKASFALRALCQAADRVRVELKRGRIEEARAGLRSLCSRDSSTLGERELVAGTVESLAENASDSFVAPLLFYACFGVPGALFYRAVNTLDAMIGYHGHFEYLGKASARLDDALNFIPARLTAAALIIAGSALRADAVSGIRIWLRDSSRTESPNAGRPMAAMAGLLGVALEKDGAYRLGDARQALSPATIAQASAIVILGASLTAGALAFAIGVRHALAA